MSKTEESQRTPSATVIPLFGVDSHEETKAAGNNLPTTNKANSVAAAPAVADSSDDSNLKPSTVAESRPADRKKSWRFYALIAALGFTGLLTALEGTITSVALPTIVDALGGSRRYIWVGNVYFLATTVFQPSYGQLANIFGRRYPTLIATAVFVLGSGICGGANNMQTLIAGRAVQGAGASGINVLAEILICDLVPLQERGKYVAVIFGFVSVGTALGPLFGGLLVQNVSWRWIFYLNLPIGGTAFLLLAILLQVEFSRDGTVGEELKKIDWIGNILLILSLIALLTALSWAGTKHSWSSYQIILPLILGLGGCIAFLLYEGSKYCMTPTMPLHLFRNRTSLTAYILTFLHSMATVWTVYFLPLYFQGVLASSPARSGIQLLPTILFTIPFTLLAGKLLSKFGRYRIVHHVGFALMTVGFGLFSLFDEKTSIAEWVFFQAIEAAGAGLIIPALLPAVQAQLSDADNALSTSTWAFIRSFGMIWGTTVPAAIFNNISGSLSTQIADQEVATELADGSAYQSATKAFLESLSDPVTRSQVIHVFSNSLSMMWYIAIVFPGLGFLLVIGEKEVPLRENLETEFGLKNQSSKSDTESPSEGTLPQKERCDRS